MIITKQKEFKDILKYLGDAKSIFLIGCGECSTTCKTGGEDDIRKIKEALEKEGKSVTGYCIPSAPCIAAKVKLELAKNRKTITETIIRNTLRVLFFLLLFFFSVFMANYRLIKKTKTGCRPSSLIQLDP